MKSRRHHRPLRLRQIQCDKIFSSAQGYPCVDADLVAREVLAARLALHRRSCKQRSVPDIADENGECPPPSAGGPAPLPPRRAQPGLNGHHPAGDPAPHRNAALARRRAGQGQKLAFVDGAGSSSARRSRPRCDALVLVTAPYDTSVARICARDGIAPEMARRRLDAQTPIETLRAAATARARQRWHRQSSCAEKLHAVLQQKL